MFPLVLRVTTFAMVIFLGGTSGLSEDRNGDRIQPYSKNPSYWQYKGRPVILLGGSKDDSLFQIPDLQQHLDLLASAGGNYIRNTMSDRPDHDFEVYPFLKLSSGKFDLDQWNPEYWRRFDNLLHLTRERDIIVQIEVWDRFDHSRENWEKHPYNPKNNVNYSYEESGFAEKYPDHPGSNKQPFFYATPRQRNNEIVFKYQKRFVDEILNRSFSAPNVLYCMDNETSGDPSWGAFWAEYIASRAKSAGVKVYLTEMWDEWNLKAPQHRQTFDHPELYAFADVSQNNHQKGQTHWDNFQWVRERLSPRPRPINTVKTYGADTGRYGTTQDGLERWWRHLIGGAAAVRFHRPGSGIGLNETAQAHIRSARMLTKEFDFTAATPDVQSKALGERDPDEAYLTTIGEKQYLLYFPRGGSVTLKLKQPNTRHSLRWLDLANSRWTAETGIPSEAPPALKAPSTGHWIGLIHVK